MIRSLSFESNYINLKRSFKTCFRYAFFFQIKLANIIKLLAHYTKGTLSLKKTSIELYFRFQVLFHTPL